MWVFGIIGKVLTAFGATAALVVLSSLAAAAYPATVRLPFKHLWVAVLEWLYSPLRWLFHKLGRGQLLDGAMVELRNRANERRFACSQRRILLAPHCLRSVECPAVSTQDGIKCVRCGKCPFATILAQADELGYRTYILAGSSFIPAIIRRDRPEGILLLACPYESNKVMMHLRGLATYAVCLTRDGCVLTEAPLEKLHEAMRKGK